MKKWQNPFSVGLTQLNCCAQHLSFNTPGLMFDTRKKKKQSKELSSFSPSCSGKKVACLLIQREKDTEIFTDTENKFSVTRRETRWDKLGVWG